jgi:hypothetical protein
MNDRYSAFVKTWLDKKITRSLKNNFTIRRNETPFW